MDRNWHKTYILTCVLCANFRGGESLPTASQGESKEKIVIRLELNGPIRDKFKALMQYYGCETYTALVRLLISMKSEQLEKPKPSS